MGVTAINDIVSIPGLAHYRVGTWDVDVRSCRLVRNGTVVKVSPRNMNVLAHLAERAGETISHEELLNTYWRGAVSSTNAVHKAVAELRQALGNGDDGQVLIETVPKRGYRLAAAVVRIDLPVGVPVDALQQDPLLGAWAGNEGKVPDETAPPALEKTTTPSKRQSIARVAAAVVAMIAAVATLAWLTRSTTDSIRVITLGGHTAALLPSTVSHPGGGDGQSGDVAIDQAITRLAAMPGYQIHTGTLARDLAGRKAAEFLGADFAVEIEVTQTADRLQAKLAILPIAPDGTAHHEQIERPLHEHAAFIDDLSEHLTEDLAVLMDDARVGQMHEWGTRSVHAYRLAVEGDSFQRIQTIDSLLEAEGRFMRAIDDDPAFAYGYLSLSTVYWAIAQNPRDNGMFESVRRRMQALLRRSTVNGVATDVQAQLQRQYDILSIGNAFEAEALWHRILVEDPDDLEALRMYARLLVGSKHVEESERYIERALKIAPKRWQEALKSEYATTREAAGDLDRALEWTKWNTQKWPDFTLSLFGLVRGLGQQGKLVEAENYLQRLKSSDPVWGRSAELSLQVQRGEIAPGSPELERILADESVGYAMRGILCFMLDDVERGARFWRRMEPAFLRLMWQFNSSNERYFATGIVSDPRYQALLDELGIGGKWRAYMREKAAELTPVTGIPVTSPVPPEDRVRS